MIVYLVVSLLLLSFLSLPIAWALGIAALGALLISGDYPLTIIAQRFISGMNSFSLMAIPFFILSGDLMTAGGLTKRLIDVARALVGWVKGSVSIVTIVAAMFFGAISGSSIATASAIGGMTIPEMLKDKYDRSYAAAVNTGAAACGMLIPPSIALIVYASITSISVRSLFIGTVIPGVLYGFLLCFTAYLIAKKRNYSTHERAGVKEIVRTLKSAIFAILMPVIILGCIFGGITTPTEASVIAVAYALVVGLFIHKDLKVADLPKIFYNTAITTSFMFMLIGASQAVSWIVAVSNVSNDLTNWIMAATSSKFLIILFITAVCIVLGCLMDAVCAILIITPVLYTLAGTLGYSPFEFGVILCTLLTLGHLTPPVGASLLLSNSIAKADMSKTIIDVAPFFLCGMIVVTLCWVFPTIVSFLI